MKEQAKELINSFYQPLGYLNCQVPSNKMWDYAKESALISIDNTINAFAPLFESGLNNDFDLMKVRGELLELKQAVLQL